MSGVNSSYNSEKKVAPHSLPKLVNCKKGGKRDGREKKH